MSEGLSIFSVPETGKSEHTLLVPGHFFFIHSVDVPEGLGDSEWDDFAELSLESVAPFPLEQLRWGYLRARDGATLLLYAAHQERLANAGFRDLEPLAWVLPDFAPLAGLVFEAPTVVLSETPVATSALFFPARADAPAWITAEAGPAGESGAERCLRELRQRMGGAADDAPVERITPVGARYGERGLPQFLLARQNPGETAAAEDPPPTAPGEERLWRADIRPTAFKRAERAARRTGALLSRIMVWAAAFALLLLVLEGLLLGGRMWVDSLQAKIAEQRTAVLTIQDKQSLMNKLRQVARNELRPVAVLERLNQKRPEGIYFTSTVTGGENKVTIDGIANTINELNEYTRMLRESGDFELIGSPKTLTRQGKTTFTVTLALESAPGPTPDAEAEAEAEAGSGAETSGGAPAG